MHACPTAAAFISEVDKSYESQFMDFHSLSFSGAPSIKSRPPGPKSQEYLSHQSCHEGSVVSYPKGMPMAIQRARGATVEDVDGNLYIDFFGGAGVMNVGHSNPVVVEAAVNQMSELTHALDFPTPSRKLLVDSLSSLLPPELSRLSFGGPTGSDAVESAIKLAKFHTKRSSLIAFEGSYHGMTAGALAVTSGRHYRQPLQLPAQQVNFVPYAYCYRCPFNKKPSTCELECAQYLDHVLEDSHSGVNTPAAVIIEPIQGEGGSIVPHEQFLPEVRKICDKHDVVMIADEVQSGFCRTGELFAFEHTDTVPDIVTMSKALGGIGLPISGIAYREELNSMAAGQHIGTFRGNVTAYAAGAAALEFMVSNDLAAHSACLGDSMLRELRKLQDESTLIGEVRGKGLMLGVEFVKDRATKKPAPAIAVKVRSECHRRGLLLEIGGHYGNVARFLPPLVLTQDLASKGIGIFGDVVRETECEANNHAR
jgi:diaminobutyrate-2-oxoglutarate transaminase